MKAYRLLTVATMVAVSVVLLASWNVSPADGRRPDRARPAAPVPQDLTHNGFRKPSRVAERPHMWKLQEALLAPVSRIDPDAPIVDVPAEAAGTPPGPGDLAETIDVQITQEIIDKAAELGTPQAMYEFVRNEFEFEPYYGSHKGSVETLRQGAGNDYDLASVLIALLRAEGYPARYAEGQVEMTVDQVTSWLAVDSGEVAGSILFTNGMEGISIIGGGDPDSCCVAHGTPGCNDPVVESCVCAQDTFCCNVQWDSTCVDEVVTFGCGVCEANVVAVRAQRVWVEAWVPHGFGSATWVPLDPAFKLSDVQPGIDIPEEMNLDAQAFLDDYWDPADAGVTLPRTDTILEVFANTLGDYVDANYPGSTLDDVLRSSEIVPQDLGILPNSLPYTVRSRDGEFSEIDSDRRYQVRFHLYDGGTPLIDHTVNLPEVAGKRVTISYEAATGSDQAIIDSFNGLLYTPPNLINLRPVLKVDGQVVAAGATSIGAGRTHSSDTHFLAPANDGGLPQNSTPSISNSIVAGELQAIGLAVHDVFNPLLQPEDLADTEGFIAQERYSKAMSYLERNIDGDRLLGSMLHARVTAGVANAIVKDDILVFTDGGGNPTDWEWRGLTVDADRLILGAWNVNQFETGCGGTGGDMLIIGGAQGSLNENLIYETDYFQEAVSTMKILQLSVDAGITVYKRWNTLPLPANTQPASVQTALQNAIVSGKEVTFPADPITYFNWTGTGYIDQDPCSGAAGYIISGGQNGGSTVDSWTDILWADPDCAVECVEGRVNTPSDDSPDPGAVFCKQDTAKLNFDYDLRIRYTVTEKCPNQYGEWTSRSHKSKSPSDLAAAHYQLTVGDKGDPADDQHKRKLTVVGLELVTPAGDPVGAPDDSGEGQNEYTFSAAAAGKFTINFKAKTIPSSPGLADAIKDDVKFTVEAVGGSTKTWNAANPGGKATVSGEDLVAEVEFSGLPTNNTDFGKKKTEVLCKDKKADEVTIEVFYTGTATNNPGGTKKNWFYYYKKNQGGANYDYGCNAGGRSSSSAGNPASVKICDEAYAGDTHLTTNVAAGQLTATGWSGTNKYYANFLGVLAHETQHATNETGAGPPADTDGDFLPSAFETATSQTDPNDKCSAAGTQPCPPFDDGEVYAGGPVEEGGVTGADTSQDWADPGTNHKP